MRRRGGGREGVWEGKNKVKGGSVGWRFVSCER